MYGHFNIAKWHLSSVQNRYTGGDFGVILIFNLVLKLAQVDRVGAAMVAPAKLVLDLNSLFAVEEKSKGVEVVVLTAFKLQTSMGSWQRQGMDTCGGHGLSLNSRDALFFSVSNSRIAFGARATNEVSGGVVLDGIFFYKRLRWELHDLSSIRNTGRVGDVTVNDKSESVLAPLQ